MPRASPDSLNLTLVTNLTRSLTPSETDEVNVKVLKGVVYISLADNMLFKSGSYEVNERAMQTLGKKSPKIIKDYSDYDVLVGGNTDDVRLMSRQDLKDNWDLSALRATSIVRILQDDFGVNLFAHDSRRSRRIQPHRRQQHRDRTPAQPPHRNHHHPKLDQFLDLIDKAPRGEQLITTIHNGRRDRSRPKRPLYTVF